MRTVVPSAFALSTRLSNARVHVRHRPSLLTFHSQHILLGKVCRVGIGIDWPGCRGRITVRVLDELAGSSREVGAKHRLPTLIATGVRLDNILNAAMLELPFIELVYHMIQIAAELYSDKVQEVSRVPFVDESLGVELRLAVITTRKDLVDEHGVVTGSWNNGPVLAILCPGGVYNPARAVLEGHKDDMVKTTLHIGWIWATLGVTADSDMVTKHL